MKPTFGSGAVIAAVLLVRGGTTIAASPAAPEGAAELIARVEAKTAATPFLSADLTGSVRDQRPGRVPLTTISGRVRFARPNLARIEFRATRTGHDEGPTRSEAVIASDGATLWRFDGPGGRYRRRTADTQGNNIGDGEELVVSLPASLFFRSRVPRMDVPPASVGTETSDGTRYRVVEYRDPSEPSQFRQRFYIGPDGLVHRMTSELLGGKYVVEWALTNVRTGEGADRASFAYAPPPGAKEEARPAPPPLLAAGSTAPDFTVKGTDGKPVRLSDFKGKVVVLDFWATWCGPCLESLPHTAAVARKFVGDVVVLAVNVWDKEEAFRAWLPKNPQYGSLRFAIDTSPQGKDVASALYKAPGIPTQYVIGRDGRIFKGFLGYDGPTPDLEKAIIAAGGKRL